MIIISDLKMEKIFKNVILDTFSLITKDTYLRV